MEFVNLQQRVIELVQGGKNNEALSLIEEAKQQFPHKLDRLGHWKANLYTLEGKKEKAMAELEEVLENGLWWNPEILTSDPELEGIKGMPEFTAVIDRCQSIFEQEQQITEMKWKTSGDPDNQKVIFPLHWKGSNMEDFAQQWSEEEILADYFLGIPQSSQIFSYNCYAWDDREVAVSDVLHAFRAFEQKYDIKGKEVILAGASQGGHLAALMSLRGDVEEFNEFIAVVPAFEADEIKEIIETNPNPKARGCIITGDRDPFYKQALETADLLKSHNIPCELMMKEGMGHELPEDFPGVLKEASAFVTTK
ncbi:alpha/beta hydrolase [Halobacillus litoralis]|uniref:alpha/beta hydrolase n=1 Tax=Halobacillus litoralis TaxID=45668 RepID=UPI001CFE5880|nr:DUF3089 domain-containing protein [Halobacillus litoralis]